MHFIFYLLFFSKEFNQIESKEKVEPQDISKDISNQSDAQNSINEERKNVPLSNAGDTLNKSTNKVFVYIIPSGFTLSILVINIRRLKECRKIDQTILRLNLKTK